MKKYTKEESKKMLILELIIGWTAVAVFTLCIISAAYLAEIDGPTWAVHLLATIAVVVLFVMVPIAIRLEQLAGFYNCSICGHKHVPSYFAVFTSIHLGTTRYLQCPKCGRWSWEDKTLE